MTYEMLQDIFLCVFLLSIIISFFVGFPSVWKSQSDYIERYKDKHDTDDKHDESRKNK